jgi:hypothetical protein
MNANQTSLLFNEEIWKDIPGYENKYQVSNHGRFKSLSRIMLMRGKHPYMSKDVIVIGGYNKYGYHTIGLRKENLAPKKTFIAHRIVAQVFIPNPENKPQVNHINGVKADNRVENLEWNTASENAIHAYNNKLMVGRIGINNPQSKLTELDIIEIRKSNIQQKDLAIIYKVSRAVICRIKKRKGWNHI